MNQTDTQPVQKDNREEVQELKSLLNQKPEIMKKVEYYKAILRANDLLVQSIDTQLSFGTESKVVQIWFLKFVITKAVTDYERAKLLAEKIEVENQMYYQKKFFEDWLQRRNEYEVYFDKLSAECNERFEELYVRAQELAEHNTRIAGVMKNYVNIDEDQELKNNFYLILRQEIKAGRVPEAKNQ